MVVVVGGAVVGAASCGAAVLVPQAASTATVAAPSKACRIRMSAPRLPGEMVSSTKTAPWWAELSAAINPLWGYRFAGLLAFSTVLDFLLDEKSLPR